MATRNLAYQSTKLHSKHTPLTTSGHIPWRLRKPPNRCATWGVQTIKMTGKSMPILQWRRLKKLTSYLQTKSISLWETTRCPDLALGQTVTIQHHADLRLHLIRRNQLLLGHSVSSTRTQNSLNSSRTFSFSSNKKTHLRSHSSRTGMGTAADRTSTRIYRT